MVLQFLNWPASALSVLFTVIMHSLLFLQLNYADVALSAF